jgi:hypothetical protein
MTHYDALGVEPDALESEIRRAYLRLAREYHPDRHGTDRPAVREQAERRMRDVNAAWAELGDPGRRVEYDRRVGIETGRPKPIVNRPENDFRPYREFDVDDDDQWRFEPDPGNPATNPGRFLTMLPPLLVLAGLGGLAVGLTTQVRAFIALAVLSLLLAAVLFLGAPLVALFKSREHENR